MNVNITRQTVDAALTDGDTVDDGAVDHDDHDEAVLVGDCGICEAPGRLRAVGVFRCEAHRND
jgi:hypothetical protein